MVTMTDYCRAPRKYPMRVKKTCPYCGKVNDILIHQCRDNIPRMFCPGTNHGSLNRSKARGYKCLGEEKNEDEPEEVQRTTRTKEDEEYNRQLRKSLGLKVGD